MSLLKANSVQIGQSSTATQNFTLSVPSSPDGTIKLARGNSGATTADVLTVDASGNVTTTLANGIVTPSKLSQPLTLATAQNSTSGNSINFTGIPSWAKRITIMLLGVTKAGTTLFRIRVGTGGVASSSGYLGNSFASVATGVANANFTAGIDFCDTSTATNVRHGTIVLTNLSGNNWTFSGMTGLSDTNRLSYVSGSVALGGVLDMVSITSVGGADAFTAGTINIMYEG
jgi:hypothetical protein